MLIFGNKRQTSQKCYSNNYINFYTYFLNNVGSHAKTQPRALLSTKLMKKKTKMSVRKFLPRALQLLIGYPVRITIETFFTVELYVTEVQ